MLHRRSCHPVDGNRPISSSMDNIHPASRTTTPFIHPASSMAHTANVRKGPMEYEWPQHGVGCLTSTLEAMISGGFGERICLILSREGECDQFTVIVLADTDCGHNQPSDLILSFTS